MMMMMMMIMMMMVMMMWHGRQGDRGETNRRRRSPGLS